METTIIAKGIVSALMLYAQQAVEVVDIPMAPPQVQFVSQSTLSEQACNSHRCGARAWFSYNDGVIYLRNDQDIVRNMYARSILLHEMVHHLQHHLDSPRMANECLTWKAREIQAYKIQYRWLYENRVQVDTPAFNLPLVNFRGLQC